MNSAKAITKYVRISPRKARLSIDVIRGMDVPSATTQLAFDNTKAGRLLKKTLDSAVANAGVEFDARPEDLKVAAAYVDEGPRWKRSKPKNKGGRHRILKRTSHLSIVVDKE